MTSDQVEIWRGEFGDEYADRNKLDEANSITKRVNLFFDILYQIRDLTPILEVGAGSGANLKALSYIFSAACLMGVEPNKKARSAILENGVIPQDKIFDASAEAIPLPDGAAGLVFTSGVLIHIPPDRLPLAMGEIHRVSKKYILCIEYFSPSLEEIKYRGRDGLLWKGDYGSMYLDMFKDLRPIRNGFAWKRTTGLDNVTWHLLEKYA